MRSLKQALHDHELITLRVIGEWWELDLTGTDKIACVKALTEAISQLDMKQEIACLPPEEAAALSELMAHNGRLPVATFSRAYGEVRLMGPGRMEREEPWLTPVSAAESLWYRGFLYRGFDETPDGVIEFYYLPDELQNDLPALSPPPPATETVQTRLTPVPTPLQIKSAPIDAVDDVTTLLILAHHTVFDPHALDNAAPFLRSQHPARLSLLMTLAREMGLIRHTEADQYRPTRTAVDWLKTTRAAQCQSLADAWSSSQWNDLCHIPQLICEGENWHNDPLLARTTLIDVLPQSQEWFRVADITALIKETNPDFQRPDGNYETWYIRDATQDTYLTGFDNWDLIDGQLLAYLIHSPLHWLGMVHLSDEGTPDVSYRLTDDALNWLTNTPPPTEEVRIPLVVQPDGQLIVPHNADRYQRFQAARISQQEPVQPGQPYHYRLTPRSLAQASKQDISPERVLQFLTKASGRAIPASVNRAITRWGERGVEGRLEQVIVLRVREAAILETLRANPKTRNLLGESLGDLAVTVRPNDWQALQKATAQLGLFLDFVTAE